MATFTITALNTNIDSLAGKAGGDIYNVHGGQLVIDQDSRYGTNQATNTSLAAMTISATLGGEVFIDGSNVRLIPFDTGTGNVPASNTVISQGGVSGKLIGVWSAITSAPTAAGAAMPATGFIKVKQKAGGNFAAGALTGIGASATGADIVGWLEIIGDEAATCTVPRLGLFKTRGDKFALGTTNGAANQQFQLPTSGLTQYFPGIFVEKSVGSNTYEFYPNAGSQVTIASDIRAKVCWIDTAGLVRLGHNGTANAGYVPVTGLNVWIPNLIFQNCTTALRTANALPNATLATRYDFTTTSGGVIDIQYASMAWYMSFSQASGVSVIDSGSLEQMLLNKVASSITLTRFGIGQTATQANFALVMTNCIEGGVFTDVHWTRATLAASATYTVQETDCDGFTHINESYTALTVKANATSGNYLGSRITNSTWLNTKLVNGKLLFVTCNNITVTNTSYCDVISGTTQTTAAQNSYAWEMQVSCLNMNFSGLDFFGLTNVQPYLGLLSIGNAGCQNVKLRNIGTRSAPLDLGSVNNTAYMVVIGLTSFNIKVQRCYVSNTRTNIWTGDSSSKKIIFENCAGDFADVPTTPLLNTQFKALGATLSLSAQTAIYGTHWFDVFTSATAGRLGILMNEKTAIEPSFSSYVISGGSPKFTSAGGLFMPVINDEIIFEMQYFALGHTAFQNAAAVMAGGTIGNYQLDYQINKNVGAGYNGTWKTLSGANLSGETGIDPALGTKLKIRIKTTTTNATAITSLYVLTVSTAVAQDNQYPLDTINLELTGMQAGSDVVVLAAGTETERVNVDSIAGSTYNYIYSTIENVDIGVFKTGFIPFYIRNYALGSTDATLPVAQVADRNYSNP